VDLLVTDVTTGRTTGLARTVRRALASLAKAEIPHCVIGATSRPSRAFYFSISTRTNRSTSATSRRSIPTPTDSYEESLAAALRAGAKMVTEQLKVY
jgi:hypothetical protein